MISKKPSSIGIIQGKNSWGECGYGGPCPPEDGKEHEYYYCIYAIDKELKNGNNNKNCKMTMEKFLQMKNNREFKVLSRGYFMRKYKAG